MDKDTFLRAQYAEMIRTDDFIALEWRESVDRFIADLWDLVPASRLNRYLAPRDPSLGYHRDNVECHFHRPKRAFVKSKPKVPPPEKQSRAPRKSQQQRYAERRAAQEAARAERRQQIAAEFKAWELTHQNKG